MSSESRSEEAARSVTNVYVGIPQPPRKVGDVQFRNTSVDIACYLQSGSPFFIVTGYGKTEGEAEADAWRKLAELRAKNGMDVDGSEDIGPECGRCEGHHDPALVCVAMPSAVAEDRMMLGV